MSIQTEARLFLADNRGNSETSSFQSYYTFNFGRYNGRAEAIYRVGNPANGVFAFVIQGVFEIANRLLHSKDALALRGFEEIEFEALSNDAIVVLMEV